MFCFTLLNSLLCICFGRAGSLLPCPAFSRRGEGPSAVVVKGHSGRGEGAVSGRGEGPSPVVLRGLSGRDEGALSGC